MSLVHAILNKNIQQVEQYIAHGADVTEIDDYGYPPIIEAAIVNDTEIANILLKAGALVNQQDMAGNTALHWAVDNNNKSLCELLLKHKADPNSFNIGGQPILSKAMLRGLADIKDILIKQGANLPFALDFINTKLIGHRFQLQETVYIVNPKNIFIELEFEGFFLEFTLGIILQSLNRYRNNFAARHLRLFFDNLNIIINALSIASELIRYQQYTLNRNHFKKRITQLFKTDPLIIPLAYEGHAVGAVKFGNWLAICDRGALSKKLGSINIYRIKDMSVFDERFYDYLFYEKLSKEFMEQDLYAIPNLEKVTDIPMPSQITGNCSWANIEALIPTLLFMLAMKQHGVKTINIESEKQAALHFYHQWQEWDKDIALTELVKSVEYATPAAIASKAEIMAAIFYQSLKYNNQQDIERAEKMVPTLINPKYAYIMKSYVKLLKNDSDESSYNFMRLVQLFDIDY